VSTSTARRIMHRTGKALLWLVVALLVLALIGVIYQAFGTEIYRRIYPPLGELVDMDGHSLHINCVGEGSPTVILESGLGATSVDWANIQPEVANTTRVCAYDRAGSGWSEPGPGPGDPQQIAAELHTLLANAGIDGPYVLVGHSFGGLYVRMYAYQYPNEVEGMVLVDSSHPEQSARSAGAQTTPESSAQVLLSTQSLGDKPLAVITAGEQQEPIWFELQDELATLSSDSVHRVVEGATHGSLLDDQRDAQVTSMAILEVVEAVRNGQPLMQ
jgi:pimeloyl-ACP methyl ester carboxylesterase